MPKPKQKTSLTQNQIASVLNLIWSTARKEVKTNLWIGHDVFASIFTDITQAKAKNVIRHHMTKQIEEAGIEIVDWDNDQGYHFHVPFEVTDDQDDTVPNPVTKNSGESHRTSGGVTLLKTKYITPSFLGAIKLCLECRNARGGISFRPWLVGPKGCGKSVLFERVAQRMTNSNGDRIWSDDQIVRTSLATVQDPDELIGSMIVEAENGVAVTKLRPGLLTQAAEEGLFLILDELDRATPQANQAFQTITENDGKMVIITEKGRVVIEAHPNFVICVTSNTEGFGDMTDGGFFPDSEMQNISLLDRFGPKFHMDYDEKMERIVVSHLVSPNILKFLYGIPRNRTTNETSISENDKGFVYMIREACKRGDIVDQLSFRTITRFCELVPKLGWHMALAAFLNDMNPMFRDVAEEMIVKVMGEALRPSEDFYLTSNPKNQHVRDALNDNHLPFPETTRETHQTFTMENPKPMTRGNK